MPESIQNIADKMEQRFAGMGVKLVSSLGELTAEIPVERFIDVTTVLRDEFGFAQLIDLCGVDYSTYAESTWTGKRFAVVCHLLSITNNQRLRVKTFLDDEFPMLDTLTNIWPASNWFEREAFDLYGIVFNGHPDLRRILTDYGFVGHPFRKDFPLSGNVEMRYDEEKKRVIYQPVSIEPRINVPRVIRDDHRYAGGENE